MRRHTHRLLTGRRIKHEQYFLRLGEGTQAHEFLHKVLINL